MKDTVAQEIDQVDRERLWNRAYEELARLKADSVAWKDYLDEIAVFDRLAGDGFEGEVPYYTPEEEREIIANAGLTRHFLS